MVHRPPLTVLDIPCDPFRQPLSGLSMRYPELDCIERSVEKGMDRFGGPDAHVAPAYPRDL